MRLIDKFGMQAENILKNKTMRDLLKMDIINCLREIIENAPDEKVFDGFRLRWNEDIDNLELFWRTKHIEVSVTIGPTIEEFGWEVCANGATTTNLWEVGCEDVKKFYSTLDNVMRAA